MLSEGGVTWAVWWDGGESWGLLRRLAGSGGLDWDGAQRVRGAYSLSARFAAGVNARPTEPGKHGGHPGNTIPAAHRRGGFHIRPVYGGAGFRGRGMPLPYMPSGHDRPTGIAAAARANVGRDALIPPGPAAA